MASRKAALLVDPSGQYMVNYGYWNVADFVAANGLGTYKIELLPANARLLRADVDLNIATDGNVGWQCNQINGASVLFTVPEPMTLAMLALVAPLLRRRRRAR